MKAGRVHAKPRGPKARRRFVLAGLLLSAATVSSRAGAAGGISCPSGTPAVRSQEEPEMEASASSPDASRRTVAAIDAVRPPRTEVATFALG